MNWRDTDDTTFASWDSLIPAHSNIKKRNESLACYDAARPLSRLCLGVLKAESSFATRYNRVPPSMNNPLNLKYPTGGEFMSFGSIADCVRAWKSRITSLTYKNGVYARTTTIADLVNVYAPSSDNNNVRNYVATIEGVIASLPVFPDQTGESDTAVQDSEGFELNMTPGLIPEAGYADRLILDSQNQAWNNLGQRTIRGFVLHRMLGSLAGTDNYFRSGAGALTDMGQDADSDLVYRWNDPTGAAHAGVSANRAPWATGPYRATAYGDGLKFVNKYGVNAVNRDQRSWEIDGFYADPWSNEAMREAAQTCAHDAHNYGITWDQFPYSQKDSCSFVRWHNEFTGLDYKECPGSVVMNQTDEFIGMVKAIMKAAQQTGVPIEPERPVTPIPINPYPKGASPEWVREVYGELTVPWASEPFRFDLERSECRRWLAFCTSTIPPGGDYTDGNWGELKQVIRRGNKGDKGRDFRYANGLVIHQEPPDKQKGG